MKILDSYIEKRISNQETHPAISILRDKILAVECDLSLRVAKLEKKIAVLECDEHKWGRPSMLGFSPVEIYGVECICSKCGDATTFTLKEWEEIQLDQALDEVERLGGEVER